MPNHHLTTQIRIIKFSFIAKNTIVKQVLFHFLTTLLVFSCCSNPGDEISRNNIPVTQKNRIPYENQQIVNMQYNESYEFILEANVNNFFTNDQEFCEDYNSYEHYSVNLNSEIPQINIEIQVMNDFESPLNTYISLKVNRVYFSYDESMPLETLDIGNTTYTEVYRYSSSNLENQISEIFYNETQGILKINYNNGDYVHLIP